MIANSAQALRLLIVDDEELDRQAVVRAVRGLVPAPTFLEARSISEAERRLAEGTFDCVVLDYRLPEGPCTEFLAGMQARAPGTAFVVLTGQGDESIAVELMKAGAADYLSKENFDPTRVRHAVKYAVALHRAEEQAAEAEARRRHYAQRLQRFVEHAPALVAARSLQELAHATADVALEVLEAREAYVVLRHAGVEYLASRGQSEDKSGLVRWATETMQRAPDSFVDGELMVVPMRTRDGESRGFVALGKPVGQGPRPEDQLLKQLAVLSSVCSDSLVLLDAAARASRARDDVMAVVSHDLRAPLNNVRLGANLLREGAEPHVVPVLERIERNVTHMTRLVDDLVDMVRLEAGRLQVNPTPENVHELMHAASHLVTEQASVNQLHLQVLDCASHLAVHADRDRVLQVLANLLGNAVKFTSPGGSIELGAHDDGTFVRFTVRDTGRGISPEEGDRVFSRFWQSDPKKRRGLGLGLYIAKGLIQAQGGKLWYESKPGEGTCFSFTLPKPVAGAHARIA